MLKATPTVVLLLLVLGCVGGLPWALATDDSGVARFERTDLEAALMPPRWAPHRAKERATRDRLDDERAGGAPAAWFGTDRLGRDLLARCMVGGCISGAVGLSAAALATVLGTAWGAVAGMAGRRVDAVMMRTVDVLYGLPNILLVVLLSVAFDGVMRRQGRLPTPWEDAAVLLIAIGAVSWLTMARVIRGQTLSLCGRPFMDACRAMGMSRGRRFFRHLLPNLSGPIIVYATLAVPSAILAEAFLGFLGLGVREPLPSWGGLAASGLAELNPVRARWWLLVFPCVLVAATLLGLNFVGEAVRARFDPSVVRRPAGSPS